MKFRAVPGTELLFSETALALDDAGTPADAAAAERILRLAYDEGINLFLASGASHDFDGGFAVAFPETLRSKIMLALRLVWTGDAGSFSRKLDARLKTLATDRTDILIVDGLCRDDLHAGALADAVHRLRVSGRVGHAGARAARHTSAEDVRLFERNGFDLMEEDARPPFAISEDRGRPVLARPARLEDADALSFLWEGTGRTAAQASVQLALAQPGVCSVLIHASTPAEMKDLARAPLAPAFLPDELAAARTAFSTPLAVAAGV